MTSRNSFFKLLKEDLLQRLWSIILAIVVIFIPMTVFTALQLGDIRNAGGNYLENAIDNLYRSFSYDNIWFAMIVLCGAVICAVCSYGYLFSKKQVDFFHSLPVGRGKQFTIRYLSGVLVYAVPSLVMYVVNYFMVALSLGFSGALVKTMCYSFFFHLLGFLVIYSAVSICIFVVGNMAVLILMGGWMFAYFLMFTALFLAMKEAFYQTFFFAGNNNFFDSMSKVRWLSPGYYYLEWTWEMAGRAETNQVLLYLQVLLYIAVLTAIAFVLYKKRPSEGAGKAIVFGFVKPVIRFSTEVLLGVGLAYSFYEVVDAKRALGWMIFGAILGVVLMHIFVESVFHYDVRKCFAHPLSMLVGIAASIAMILVMHYDLTGYDDYVPKKNKIESVEIWKFQGEYYYRDYGKLTLTLQDVDKVYPFLEACEKNRFNLAERERKSAFDSTVATQWIKFCVHRKNGTKVYRTYLVSQKMIADYMGVIYNSAEYKEELLTEVRALEKGTIGSVLVRKEEETTLIKSSFTEAEKEEILQALINGQMRTNWQTVCDEAPLFLLEVSRQDKNKDSLGYEYYSVRDMDIPIYSTYTELLSILEAKGYAYDAPRDWSKVDMVTFTDDRGVKKAMEGIYEYYDEYYDGNIAWESMDRYYDYPDNMLVNPDDWGQLYSYCVWDELTVYGLNDLLYIPDCYVTMQIRIDDFGNYNYVTYRVRKGADLSFLYD